jgi:hypothetical protein
VGTSASAGSTQINLPGGYTRHVRIRTRDAVIRVHPRMKEESHGDDYFYGLLLQHVPFRDEAELVRCPIDNIMSLHSLS